MSAAAAPNPSNLVLLAALGIGAYWFFSRKATGGTLTAQQVGSDFGLSPGSQAQRYAANDGALWAGVGSLLKGITNSISGNQAANNANVGKGQSVAYSPSDDNSVFANDGVAVNPAGTLPWDQFFYSGTGGSGD